MATVPPNAIAQNAWLSMGRSCFSTATRRRRPTGVRRGFLPRGKRLAARREVLKMVPLLPKLPKPPTAIVPKPLQSVPLKHPPSKAPSTLSARSGGGGAGGAASKAAQSSSSGGGAHDRLDRLREWLRQNGPILILNFGSLCTLTGFTRHDVLELRALSMTGSISSVIYFLFARPVPWVAVGWSSIFAATNAFNIYRILDERSHRVVLSDDEEKIFVEHFMPHGLTPKQFKWVMAKSELVTVDKGTAITKQGQTLDSVYLVVGGNTRGSVFGRRISAVSSVTGNRKALTGGDSGAWIGEIAFLEKLWQEEHPPKAPPPKEAVEAKAEADAEEARAKLKVKDDREGASAAAAEGVERKGGAAGSVRSAATREAPVAQRPSTTGRALYTIVAEGECCLLRWSHSDLKGLMKSSSDMRSAMTRAMTAAVVGKVVNFTVSRSTGRPTWSTWLDEWKHSGGARVNVNVEKVSKVIKDHIAPQ